MNEMEITATRTPEIIAGEIRTFTASMLNNVIEIGRRMIEVKKLLPYGTFGKWIQENTGYSSSTADNFMRLFQEYGADQGCLFGAEVDCQTFGKLSYSKALALLSVPKEEREEVALELDAEHLSTRELKQALAERDEARKALEEAERALREAPLQAENEKLRDDLGKAERAVKTAEEDRDAAEKAAEELSDEVDKLAEERDAQKRRIIELEARPVEVAVERDEEAIRKAAEEARKTAEAAGKAEADKLREKLRKAQEAKKEAKAALEKARTASGDQAAQAREEAETARREAEELRKKLRAAESGAGEVSMLARQAQVNFEAAMEKIAAMSDREIAGKMLLGMERIAGNLAERIREAKDGI